jgi:hypothetical protein
VVNSGRRRRRACAGNTSGGELLATLAPTTGEDRPARAGAHTQPEAVGLGPTTGVRLERALAHEVLPLHDIDGAHPPVSGCTGRPERVAGRRTPENRAAGHCVRNRPQTPASITEDRLIPATGRMPTTHVPPPGPGAGGGTPSPTRLRGAPARCRAVDGAVSVAVAPHRTSGSRRGGRPRRSTDRRIARITAMTGL